MNKRLTPEERVWRYNYIQRFFAGVIPPRNSFDPMHMTNVSAWWSDTHDGPKHDAIFNTETGLFEERYRKEGEVVTSGDEEHKRRSLYTQIMQAYDSDILKNTVLPPPPSDRALPPAVKATAREKLRFLEKCPDYVRPYAEKLFKEK